AACERETNRAGQQAADQDHRAEHVHAQREVPAGAPDEGEDAHAPGLKIMSRRIRSTTTVAADCSIRPRDVRLIASSSALGPVWPAAWRSFAFFWPLRSPAPVRAPTAPEIAHSTIAATIQPSQIA